jgi:hypothetical protein
MVKQKVMAGTSMHVRLPLWKRLLLVTALLLSGETLVTTASSQAAHANSVTHTHANGVTYIMCRAGDGGHGGVATFTTDGGRGGNGGDCLINGGAKGGTGGTSTGPGGHAGEGGNVFFHH